MDTTITTDLFTRQMSDVLDEIFEQHHGIFLDENNSIFDTLNTINAGEASQPVGGKCATLAAQVAHVTFYLDVVERFIRTQASERVDWGEVWRTVDVVAPQEWEGLRQDLKRAYQKVLDLFRNMPDWNDEISLGGMLGIMVHTAYHLGEIRQALCTLK